MGVSGLGEGEDSTVQLVWREPCDAGVPGGDRMAQEGMALACAAEGALGQHTVSSTFTCDVVSQLWLP
jgi:hypothetical protein